MTSIPDRSVDMTKMLRADNRTELLPHNGIILPPFSKNARENQ
jgi:hypothetical protein